MVKMKIYNEICSAIRLRQKIEFLYQNDIGVLQEKKVNPYVLGDYGNTSIKILQAWQTGGESDSDKLPGWRSFHLDKIQNLITRKEKFVGPDGGYKRPNQKFKAIDIQY